MTTENTTPATTNEVSEQTGAETPAKNPDAWDDTPEDDGDKSDKKADGQEAKGGDVKDKQPAKKERKLRKVNIDGKEEVVDEEQVFRDYQKYRSADREKKELAEARKRLDGFLQKFQEDPAAFLQNSKVPLNRKELALKWLEAEIEKDLKSPVEVELEEKNAKLKSYEEREAEEKARQAAEERTRKVDGRRQELAKVFAEAMKESPLAKDPKHSAEVLREMAMYMRVARQNGDEVTPEELAAHVENQKLSQYHAVASTLEGEDLIKFLGDKIVNKIRKADIQRLKSQRGISDEMTEPADTWTPSTKKDTSRGFVDPVTAREQVRKKLGLS